MIVAMNFSDETMRRKAFPMTTIETISWSKKIRENVQSSFTQCGKEL